MPLMMHISTRCLWLASDYLIHTNRFHRWCILIVACAITLLLGCFIAFAVAEKYQIESNFFYGRLQFSFIDGGYPEMLSYGLELASCAIFLWFAWTYQKKYWYAWTAIMFVVFLDDAFQLHESIGSVMRNGFGASPVAGDLIGFASTGLLSAVFWLIGVRFLTSHDELCAYLVFTVYFALLIFFGVGVDAMHGLFGEHVSQTLFTLFEDGGELLMTAVISLSALGMLVRQRQPAVIASVPIISVFSKP